MRDDERKIRTTSSLFVILEQTTTDEALDGVSREGGKVIKSSLSREA